MRRSRTSAQINAWREARFRVFDHSDQRRQRRTSIEGRRRMRRVEGLAIDGAFARGDRRAGAALELRGDGSGDEHAERKGDRNERGGRKQFHRDGT